MPRNLRDTPPNQTVKATGYTFSLDDFKLMIKPTDQERVYILSEVQTLALANMLMAEYRSIVAAASKFNGIQKPGYKSKSGNWS